MNRGRGGKILRGDDTCTGVQPGENFREIGKSTNGSPERPRNAESESILMRKMTENPPKPCETEAKVKQTASKLIYLEIRGLLILTAQLAFDLVVNVARITAAAALAEGMAARSIGRRIAMILRRPRGGAR